MMPIMMDLLLHYGRLAASMPAARRAGIGRRPHAPREHLTKEKERKSEHAGRYVATM
jgi:hypothetical protein